MTAPLDLTQTPVTLPATVVPSTRTVAAGTGLTGGGNLSADRTFAVAYGTTAGTAAQGNDSRLSDARTPTAHVHSGSDITSGTVAYARLPVGTAASTVAAGDDARLSDARTPVAHTHTGPQILVSSRTVSDLTSFTALSGVALDVITTTLTTSPTFTPGGGTDGQILRIRMLASGAQRTPAVSTSVRTGTGITDRSMAIPSGQWGVFGLEYIGGLNLWVLFSEYVVSAS